MNPVAIERDHANTGIQLPRSEDPHGYMHDGTGTTPAIPSGMTSQRISVSKKDKAIKAIVEACYPEYKGRKIAVQVSEHYGQMRNYWCEGSRDYVVAYDLASGKVAEALPVTSNPYRPQAHAELAVPAGILIVEHTISCGKDCGITIHVNPANVARMLPAATALEAAS